MKSEAEKAVLYLTIPSLIGIFINVIGFFFPHLTSPNFIPIGATILLACGVIGLITSLLCFWLIKERDNEISLHVKVIGWIINSIWIIYIIYTLATLNPLPMQK